MFTILIWPSLYLSISDQKDVITIHSYKDVSHTALCFIRANKQTTWSHSLAKWDNLADGCDSVTKISVQEQAGKWWQATRGMQWVVSNIHYHQQLLVKSRDNYKLEKEAGRTKDAFNGNFPGSILACLPLSSVPRTGFSCYEPNASIVPDELDVMVSSREPYAKLNKIQQIEIHS